MLQSIGVPDIETLFKDVNKFKPASFELAPGKSEFDVLTHLHKLAAGHRSDLMLFIGGGYYDHYVPPAVTALASRGEFTTAYTPYQPECSQGTLQALYEFQSSVCTLTDMDVANASLYDGGTALYEAMMMALRITRRTRIIMDGGVSPIYRKILRSYTKNLHIEFVEAPVVHGRSDRDAVLSLVDKRTAALILQNPNFFGAIDDHTDLIDKAHAQGALVIESVYPLSLGLLKTPGEMGADIVTGEAQSLGLPLNFGGPYLGFMATRRRFVHKMPGRIVGETVDTRNRRCFVNTLQAREQHIRREKATSNICTNVALNAIQAQIYLALLGKSGIEQLALLNLEKAEFARQCLEQIPGIEVKRSSPTFNEFTVFLPCDAMLLVSAMLPKGYVPGFPLGRYYPGMENYMTVAVTEKRTREEILRFSECLKESIVAIQHIEYA